MDQVVDGGLVLRDGAWHNRVTLACWQNECWEPLPLTVVEARLRGARPGLVAELRVERRPFGWDYTLRFSATFPTRLRLALELGDVRDVFHVIPACIFGDNNLAHAEPGHYPNLTTAHPGTVSCSPVWEFRADRAALPLSLVCFAGGVAGVSIDPYSRAPVSIQGGADFIRNGVFAQLADGAQPPACGVTVGYRNTPRTFINKDQWGEPTAHLSYGTIARGRLYLRPDTSRLGVHDLLRVEYGRLRQKPEIHLGPEAAVRALTDAFLTVNWQEDKEHFTNQRCTDPERKVLVPWRTLAEIGWTGGGVIAYPLLVAARRLKHELARRRAVYVLDWVAQAANPASGLLWEVCGKQEGKRLNWWWSGYLVKDCHCAYTNGSAAYYLLKAYLFMQRQGEEHAAWRDAALGALDTIIRLQAEDGSFGYTYAADRPAVLDAEGFAGVWFVPALLLAFQATANRDYLRAAQRGLTYYHRFVRDLACWGTPMDTWKSVDQEGNLGFIRGAALLHQVTGDDAALTMLRDAANYEYLWRYGFRARPEYPPLKDSIWSSCGGSVTSVSNPHIHPMGIMVSSELRYLVERTGDGYHQLRYEDGLVWGATSVALYPEVTGYGRRGVLTERFCPSDGLTIETRPDGSPCSIWHSYNGWAAAAVLEGLGEQCLV